MCIFTVWVEGVRWSSQGNSLKRICEPREEIITFLRQCKHKKAETFDKNSWCEICCRDVLFKRYSLSFGCSQWQAAALSHSHFIQSSARVTQVRSDFLVNLGTSLHRDLMTLTFPKICCILWGTHSQGRTFHQRAGEFLSLHNIDEGPMLRFLTCKHHVNWRMLLEKRAVQILWPSVLLQRNSQRWKQLHFCVLTMFGSTYTWIQLLPPEWHTQYIYRKVCIFDKWPSASLFVDCPHFIWA